MTKQVCSYSLVDRIQYINTDLYDLADLLLDSELVNETPVESVAAQEETIQEGNDPVPPPPADVDQPDFKRMRTDDGASDIPVPTATEEPILTLNDPSMNLTATAEAGVPSIDELKSVLSPSLNNSKRATSSSSAPSSDPSTDPFNRGNQTSATNQTQAKEDDDDIKTKDGMTSNSLLTLRSDQNSRETTNVQNQTDGSSSSFSIKGSSSRNAKINANKDVSNSDITQIPSSSAHVQANESSLDMNGDAESSHPPPSASIYVSNLVRPFTLSALKSKLEEFGQLEYFWINSIKSHCFVTVSIVSILIRRCLIDFDFEFLSLLDSTTILRLQTKPPKL